MIDLRVIESTQDHAIELGRTLRHADALEGIRLGLDVADGVRWSYRRSVVRRTALVEGRVAAMWGAAGSPLGEVGEPWLLTAQPCLAVSPLVFARVYFREARAMLRVFPKLENYVDAAYPAAVRLLRMAGFRLDEPAPYGPRGEMFRRFEMVA